jgi:VNT family MFS transporter (synaptic vesicle glycoprotein 2)
MIHLAPAEATVHADPMSPGQVGVGPFQVMALVVCGLANAADAVEILGMSLVLPAAEGDPGFDLSQRGKAALSSCIFLGMLIGGLLWGPMGDVLGECAACVCKLLC